MYAIIFYQTFTLLNKKVHKLGLQTASFIADLYLRLQHNDYDCQLSYTKHSSHLVNVPETFSKHKEGFTSSKRYTNIISVTDHLLVDPIYTLSEAQYGDL